MAETVEYAAHYDGHGIVLDEPIELAAGARLKVRLVVESNEERKARLLQALREFGELGRGGVQLEARYLDDRETYYDDDHRAGLD